MMKLAIRIFTFYIIALSLVPCGDGGGGILVIAKHLFNFDTQEVLDYNQNSDPCEDSPCSPFCICSSCFTALDTVKEICLPEKVVTTLHKTTPSYIARFLPFSFNHSIWQPPKLDQSIRHR